MSWLRGSLTDASGLWDVAYVALFGVAVATIGAIPFMCAMSAVAYFRCHPSSTLACAYDPQPLGTAIGLVCGAFSTALVALAAYMAATRPRKDA